MIKDTREVFHLKVRCEYFGELPNFNKTKVELYFLKLHSEYDEDITFSHNTVYTTADVEDDTHFILNIFIVNDSDNQDERIDYKMDEDFEIAALGLEIRINKILYDRYTLIPDFYEQVIGTFEVELPKLHQKVLDTLEDNGLDSKQLDFIYSFLKEDTGIIKKLDNLQNLKL